MPGFQPRILQSDYDYTISVSPSVTFSPFLPNHSAYYIRLMRSIYFEQIYSEDIVCA